MRTFTSCILAAAAVVAVSAAAAGSASSLRGSAGNAGTHLPYLGDVVPPGLTPQQVHIAYSDVLRADGSPSGIMVQWVTNGTDPTQALQWGFSSSALTSTVAAAGRTYFQDVYHWHAAINGLSMQPSTVYFRVGSEVSGWSDTMTAQAPPDSSVDRSYDVAVVGDMGITNSDGVRALLSTTFRQSTPPLALLHIGDVSYADDTIIRYGDLLKFEYENTWNMYMREMQGVLNNAPWITLPGNHEAECHDAECAIFNRTLGEQLSNFTAYRNRFQMPQYDQYENMWFSTNIASIHYVAIDTETNYPNAPEDSYLFFPGPYGLQRNMLAWLEADLAAASAPAARAVRPWIIVAGHRPIYSRDDVYANGTLKSSNQHLQAAIEELLYKYNVDMYICGHKHSYERTYPVYNSTVEAGPNPYNNPRAPTHLVVGTGGNVENNTQYTHSPEVDWSATVFSGWGLANMHIVNSTHLQWQFQSVGNSSYTDAFTLVRLRN